MQEGGKYLSKKKKTIIVVAILLAIVMSFLGGQAYAKYVAQVRGEGVGVIATWNFMVNGQSEQVQKINLASTCDDSTLIDNKIAPGARGGFNIEINATGTDVGIDYQVQFINEQNKPQNLKFIYEGNYVGSITELQDMLQGTIYADDENKVITLPIEWQWDYETGEESTEINKNDVIDTQEGIANLDYTFDVIVTGTQMPTE